jgi:hypothetical protein
VRRIIVMCLLGGLATLTGCSTDDISNKANEVKDSAGALGDAVGNVHTKEACVAAKASLATVGSLAGRLAADPALARELSGQVSAAIAKLNQVVAKYSGEWAEVLQATGDLGSALRDANTAAVRVSAAQVVVVVKVAQAGCALATR